MTTETARKNTVNQSYSPEISPIRNTLTFTEAWEEVFERSLSKDKLYSECRAGRIPHLRIGTKIIFRRNTLEAWITEQELANCRN